MTEAKKEAAIVLVKYGPVILVVTNRRYGGLGLPGGKVEEGELPEVAGKREVEEETGLQVFTKDLVPVFKDYTVVEPDRMVHVFEVSDEAKKKLDALLEAWADENVPVNFWVADGTAERIEQNEERATLEG